MRPKWRTQDVDIRLALGANGRQVAFLTTQDTTLPVGAATVAAGPALRSQLFGIAPHDYSMPAGSAVLPAAIPALADIFPRGARRGEIPWRRCGRSKTRDGLAGLIQSKQRPSLILIEAGS
jgi:hypothetical protein